MNKFLLLILLTSLVYSATYMVDVPANVRWTKTSIYVHEGDSLRIYASGTWRYDPRPYFETDADGIADNSTYNGRLMAKVNGVKFPVGKSFEGKSPAEGYLYLGMHDTTDYSNNVGKLKVKVIVESSEPENSNTQEPDFESKTNTSLNDVVNKVVSNATEKVSNMDQTSKTVCSVVILLFLGVVLFARDVERSKDDEEEPPEERTLNKSKE